MVAPMLSSELLIPLIIAYESRIAETNASALPIRFLTRKEGALGLQALGACVADQQSFETAINAYTDAVCVDGIPSLDTFACGLASEKVSEAHKKYKEEMILRGAEHVYEKAYYIDIAKQIDSFFGDFSDETMLCDIDTANILECALRDGFFEQLMAYAADQNEFDITSLETTGDEIAGYCCKVLM